jgi:hypothetical protein
MIEEGSATVLRLMARDSSMAAALRRFFVELARAPS